MDIKLPANGCNISQSAGYIDNYRNNTRTRYLISENKLVQVSVSSYTSQPSGYACLSTGDIIYKPELAVYFPILAGALILVAVYIIYKITVGRILR